MGAQLNTSGTAALQNPYNWNRSVAGGLTHTKKKFNQVRTGQGSMIVNVLGHSGAMGNGAGTSNGRTPASYTVGAEPFSMAEQLSKTLMAKDSRLSCRAGGFWGVQGFYSISGNIIADLLAYDTRLATSGAWQMNGINENGQSLGGGLIQGTTSAGAYISFTPGGSFDTLDIWDVTASGSGAATIDIGGSTLATLAAGTTNSLRHTQITGMPAGTHTVFIRPTSGNIYPVAIQPTLSTASQIILRSITQSGGRTTHFTDTTLPYSTGNALGLLPADLTLIPGGLYRNDQNNQGSVTLAQTLANMQTIITQGLASGDVILSCDHQPGGAWNLSNDAGYRAGFYNLAAKNNIPLFDIPLELGNAAQASALGYFCPDVTHYLGFGYQHLVNWIGDYLASL